VRQAFTMIELIFIIVIMGILATVAIPKLAASRDDAKVVAIAQQIMTGASDITSYAISQARTENNLSKMSNTLASLERRGIMTIDVANKRGVVKVGSVNDCVALKISTDDNNDTLILQFGNPNGDLMCQQLQKTIPAEAYPMVLRGTVVIY